MKYLRLFRPAGFTIICMEALGFSIGLCYVLAVLGFAIVFVAQAVLDLRRIIAPYLVGTSARSLCHRCTGDFRCGFVCSLIRGFVSRFGLRY